MNATTYEQVLQMARQLEVAEQLRLLEALAEEVRRRVDKPAVRSIMELEGLGAGIWQGVDAQEYVDQERKMWGS